MTSRLLLLLVVSVCRGLYRVEIHIAGRPSGKKDWPTLAVEDYVKRLKGQLDVTTVWHKTGSSLEKRLASLSPVICLDPRGKTYDSEGFAERLFDSLEKGGSRLYLAIGPAEGLSQKMRQESELLSLSQLTFPHQMARVLLVEQIYRAHEIRRGSQYHK